ncbi:MAG: SurA N-terminal domain-containing protein [Desulfarculus sp.]|nr:SurA N-terminal domain-containing protein [Desulfarculus sp.]
MLDLMRKHAGSWIIKILLGAIAVAFALSWGVSSYYSRKEVAVTVNGEPITLAQVQEEHGRMVEENRRQFGPQYDRLATMLNLKERALNALIDRALLFQAAKRLGVTASDAEVAEVVTSFPAFQRGGRFDKEQYRRVLTANRLTPEAFEDAQRGQIILSKLTTMVAGAAQVSPLELEQTMDETLGKVQGVYLVFAEETYRKGVNAGAEEIEAYYQEHKRQYLVPEKIRVSYLVFPLSAYRDQAQVTDDDVAEYYESQRGQYVVPEAVHARHILIAVAENAPAAQLAQAQAQAEAILAEIKDKGADFAALAKKDSQDPGSAAAGGDLGFIQRDMTVPAFEQAIFSLQPGEVGLVQTPYGFHVVKVEERREGRVIPLEEVKGELRGKLEEQQARQLSEAAAERTWDMVNAGAKLPEAAAKAKLQVQQSPLFGAEETIPGLSGVKGLHEAFEGLIPGQAAPVIPFEGGSLVAVLEERVPEQARPLGEVEAEVRQSVLGLKARRLAQEAAEKLIAELKSQPDPVQALAQRPGAVRTAWLGIEDSVPGLTPSAPLLEALFSRPDNARLALKPVEVGADYLVAGLLGRQAPSAEEKDRRRQEVRQAMENNLQRLLRTRFLEDLRAQAKIKVMAKF